MKGKKTKASHSFFGNLAFMFKIIAQQDKGLVPLNIFFDIFNTIGELSLASFATVLTYCLEKGKSFPVIVAALSSTVLLQLAIHIFQDFMWQGIEIRRADVGRRF